MSTSISNGSITIYPQLRIDTSNVYESRNKVHELLGGGVAITFGEEPLRTGTLELLFTSESDAVQAVAMHRDGYVFQIADTAKPSLDMTYVVAGQIQGVFQLDSVDAWLVSVDVQEVIP